MHISIRRLLNWSGICRYFCSTLPGIVVFYTIYSFYWICKSFLSWRKLAKLSTNPYGIIQCWYKRGYLCKKALRCMISKPDYFQHSIVNGQKNTVCKLSFNLWTMGNPISTTRILISIDIWLSQTKNSVTKTWIVCKYCGKYARAHTNHTCLCVGLLYMSAEKIKFFPLQKKPYELWYNLVTLLHFMVRNKEIK